MFRKAASRHLIANALGCALFLMLPVACDSTDFSGGGDKSKKEQGFEGGDGSPGTPLVETFTSQTVSVSATVDVVIAVDTSGSMLDEYNSLSANLQNFLNNFLARSVDAKVTLIAGDQFPGLPGGVVIPGSPEVKIPQGLPADKFAHYDKHVHSNDAISIINNFIADTAKPFPLRNDAIVEFVVITDDNGIGFGNTAADLRQPTAKGFHFNGIIGLSTSQPTPTCTIVNVGSEYQALAQQTGGTIFDLCQTDWKKLTDDLSQSIIARAGDSFSLKSVPDTTKKLEVSINGRALGASEYTINQATKTLTILTQFSIGDQIKVSYWPKQ